MSNEVREVDGETYKKAVSAARLGVILGVVGALSVAVRIVAKAGTALFRQESGQRERGTCTECVAPHTNPHL